MASNAININAANTNELFQHIPGLTKSKAQQIITKRNQQPNRVFTKQSFVETCFAVGYQNQVHEWLDAGLIHFGPPPTGPVIQPAMSPSSVEGRTHVDVASGHPDPSGILTPGVTPGARPPIYPQAVPFPRTPMPQMNMPFTPQSTWDTSFVGPVPPRMGPPFAFASVDAMSAMHYQGSSPMAMLSGQTSPHPSQMSFWDVSGTSNMTGEGVVVDTGEYMRLPYRGLNVSVNAQFDDNLPNMSEQEEIQDTADQGNQEVNDGQNAESNGQESTSTPQSPVTAMPLDQYNEIRQHLEQMQLELAAKDQALQEHNHVLQECKQALYSESNNRQQLQQQLVVHNLAWGEEQCNRVQLEQQLAQRTQGWIAEREQLQRAEQERIAALQQAEQERISGLQEHIQQLHQSEQATVSQLQQQVQVQQQLENAQQAERERSAQLERELQQATAASVQKDGLLQQAEE